MTHPARKPAEEVPLPLDAVGHGAYPRNESHCITFTEPRDVKVRVNGKTKTMLPENF